MTLPTSSTDSYERVLRDFSERLGLDAADTDAVARGGTLEIDGVQLALCLNQAIPDTPVISIYVDVGLPSPNGESAVLRVLLQQNFHHSASRGLAYCMSPATGHVVGVLHVGLGGLEGQGLELLVNGLVDATLELRVEGLLRGPSREEADDEHAPTGTR